MVFCAFVNYFNLYWVIEQIRQPYLGKTPYSPYSPNSFTFDPGGRKFQVFEVDKEGVAKIACFFYNHANLYSPCFYNKTDKNQFPPVSCKYNFSLCYLQLQYIYYKIFNKYFCICNSNKGKLLPETRDHYYCCWTIVSTFQRPRRLGLTVAKL